MEICGRNCVNTPILVHHCFFIQDVITVQSAIRAHLYQKQYLQDHQASKPDNISNQEDDGISDQEDDGNTSTEDAVEIIQSVMRAHLTRQDILNKCISVIVCSWDMFSCICIILVN